MLKRAAVMSALSGIAGLGFGLKASSQTAPDAFPPLALPGPLGYDPAVAALDSCNRTGRNDLAAPQLAPTVVQLCATKRAVAPRNPALAALVQSCWAYTDQYTQLQVQAEQLLTQARSTPSPGQTQLVNQANALLNQSRTPLIAQAECTNRVINADEQFAGGAAANATPTQSVPAPTIPGGGGPGGGLSGSISRSGPPPATTHPGPPYVVGAADPCRPFGPGGYDWCQNPSGTRLPPGCTCATPRLPAAAAATGPCIDTPDASQQSALRLSGNEALQTFAAMGSQADRALTTFSDSIAGAAAYVLNPKAFVDQQVKNIQAMVTLLNQNNSAFNQTLYTGLLKALQQIEADPAGSLGRVAAQSVLTGAATKATGTFCSATVKAATATTAKIQGGLQNLQQLKKIRQSQPKDLGTSRLCDSINPQGNQNWCFGRAVAQDQRYESPLPAKAEQYVYDPAADVAAPPEHMEAVLQSLYGGRMFATLQPYENLAQAMGLPVPMTWPQIQANLKAAGNGARGILVVQQDGNLATSSHSVNIGYNNGVNILDTTDAQGAAGWLSSAINPAANRVPTLFWMYRTAGPDMLR